MMHRHNGPKVQYRTRKGKLRQRQRPIHSQLHKKKQRKFTKRRSWEDIGTDEEVMFEYDDKLKEIDTQIGELKEAKRKGDMDYFMKFKDGDLASEINREIEEEVDEEIDELESRKERILVEGLNKIRKVQERMGVTR